jgi:ribosome biogenesis GTPase A
LLNRFNPISRFKLRTKKRGSWFRVKKVIDRANLVLEVLDSRDPLGTKSNELEILVQRYGKKSLLVLNKTDLVPRNVIHRWIKYFESENYFVCPVNAKRRNDIKHLKKAILRISGGRRITLAVVGYPNVGKSTLINGLKGRYAAETSPMPGFTKGEKLIRIDYDFMALDTPGLLPSNRVDSFELAVKGFISPEKLQDPLSPALKLVNEILGSMPSLLEETYGITTQESIKVLEQLAAKRGRLLKGGELNVDEAARIILRDWQSGKLKFYKLPKK